MRRGLALLLVVGTLGLLGILAVAFVTLARLERRASLQRLHATKATLLARSGIEDALARIAAGQDPSLPGSRYGGEDWDGSGGALHVTYEAPHEVYRPGVADREGCPVRHAMRPSFPVMSGLDPRLIGVDQRQRGFSGRLGAGDAETYAIKVEDLNSRIHVNGGSLALPADLSNGGPNGFLLRLLDNLDQILTGTNGLGAQIVSSRPAGGYRRLEDLKPVLGTEYEVFQPYLTVRAWVDPQVAKPQPMEARPNRFLDVDAAHQANGTAQYGPAQSGDLTVYTTPWRRNFVYAWRQLRPGAVTLEPRAPLSLNAASEEVLGAALLGLRGTYLEVWEGSAGWDGGFGWAEFSGPVVTYLYPDPKTEDTPWHRTRADYGMSYGPGVTGTGGQARPWYGPSTYLPPPVGPFSAAVPSTWAAPLGMLRESEAITAPQARAVAQEVRKRIAQAGPFRTWAEFDAFVFRLPSWEDLNMNGVADGAPYTVSGYAGTYQRRRYEREDADSDGVLDRQVFTVSSGNWGGGDIVWVDVGGSGVGAGNVKGLTFVQKDVIRAMANPNADLNDFNPDGNLWKEVDKTDLAGIPDAPASHVHTTEFSLDGMGYVRVGAFGRILDAQARLKAGRHLQAVYRLWGIQRDTTQADFMRDYAKGRPLSEIFSGPAPPASCPLAGGQPLVSLPEPQTDGPGGLLADAAYDGQIGLGFYGIQDAPASWVSSDGTPDEKLKGNLFQTLNAPGDPSIPDAWGPFHNRLVGAGIPPGSVFPDGVYSEKDAALKFPVQGNFVELGVSDAVIKSPDETYAFWISCWVKPNWFPEASPRPHALVSLSSGAPIAPIILPAQFINAFSFTAQRCPVLNEVQTSPFGLYFVPARNNGSLSAVPVYLHSSTSTTGGSWPARALLWGFTHSLYVSEGTNRRGQALDEVAGLGAVGPGAFQTQPVGRLEGHRWVHVAVLGKEFQLDDAFVKQPGSWMVLGRRLSSPDGGGLNDGMGRTQKALKYFHNDDPADPNHLRFGEVAGENNMNYVADATFANAWVGGRRCANAAATFQPLLASYRDFFEGAGPAALGRYYKEGNYLGEGAAFSAPKLDPGQACRRVTWTEIPCDLWLDRVQNGTANALLDGWMDTLANDQFGPGGTWGLDGLRDVRIDLEIWDDASPGAPRAVYSDPAGANPVPPPLTPASRLYYKAVFVNDWGVDGSGLDIRANHPLDVTPFLDDVTFFVALPGGIRVLDWGEAED